MGKYDKSKGGKSSLKKTGNSQGSKKVEDGRTVFCRAFQRNACKEKTTPHKGWVNGKKCMVQHICARCWSDGKRREEHSEFKCNKDPQ